MSPNRELATKLVGYLQLLKAVIPDPANWTAATVVAESQCKFRNDYALMAQAAELLGINRTISEKHFRADDPAEAASIAREFSSRLIQLDRVLGLAGLCKLAVRSRSGEVTPAALRAVAMAELNETPAKAAQVAAILDFFPSFLQDLLEEIDLRLKGRGWWGRFWSRIPKEPWDAENTEAKAVLTRLGFPEGQGLNREDAREKLLANPFELLQLAGAVHFPLPFDFVQHQELNEMENLRRNRGSRSPVDTDRNGPRRALNSNLIGLTFSGGGIRSATFNLGLLQALAGFKMLRHIDCLSTVSGGGYIGAWLTSWIKRARGVERVEMSLCTELSPNPRAEEVLPIHKLREYSNYLTPETGFFSADSWTVASVYARNFLLNLLTVLSAISTVFLLPRLLQFLLQGIGGQPGSWTVLQVLAGVLALLLVAYSVAGVSEGLRSYEVNDGLVSPQTTPTRGPGQGRLQRSVALPMFVAAFLLTAVLWTARSTWNPFPSPLNAGFGVVWIWAAGAAALLFVGLVAMQISSRLDRCFYLRQKGLSLGRRVWARTLIVVFSAISAAVGGLLFRLLLLIMSGWAADPVSGKWEALIFGPAAVIQIFILVIVVQIGLLGLNFPDERREWWGRMGAWEQLYVAGWIALCGVALYGPHWVAQLERWTAAAAGTGWLVTSIAGVKAAYGGDTAKSGTEAGKSVAWKEALATVAPYVFVAGLLLIVSFGLNTLLLLLTDKLANIPTPYGDFALQAGHRYWGLLDLPFSLVLASFIGTLGLLGLLTWRVDVNEFSMHHFYKNRLVRAYLGASRRRTDRRPNAFTGFDLADDLKLTRLQVEDSLAIPPHAADASVKEQLSPLPPSYAGPFHIVNAALNITRGEELATQERKAESFVFTPIYSGFEYVQQQASQPIAARGQYGYRPTREYGYEDDDGIGLGTAVAISGAAASPNMGYHTSPPVAFLLTLFNVRMGWWLGNPRARYTWRYSSPRIGLAYMLGELFGTTSSSSDYVSLSDGGHFENLGIYELVRRRCRYIIVGDAEQDEDFKFGGLGAAIRRCRADFGVEIDIDFSAIERKPGTQYSAAHCAIGRILYPEPSGIPGKESSPEIGYLIYIKASLTGDEPPDVREYAGNNREFPHQSTGDQWFNESQFESYRRLGQHIGHTVFRGAARSGQTLADPAKFFEDVRNCWTRGAADEEHARELADLIKNMGADDELFHIDTLFLPGTHIRAKLRIPPRG